MNLPNKLTTIRLVSVPLFVIIYLIPYQSLGISMPTFDVLSTKLSLLDLILFLIYQNMKKEVSFTKNFLFIPSLLFYTICSFIYLF